MSAPETPAPHVDLDCERLVLGRVLLTVDPAEALALGVERATFWRVAHQRVWDACLAVTAAGTRCDTPTVALELGASGHLDEVGVSYLARLTDGVPRGPLDYHVGRLHTLRQAREIAVRLQALTQALADPDALTDGTVETHLKLLADVAARRTRATDWLAPDAQWAGLAAEASRDRRGRVPLGLPALDAHLEGIAPGEVCGLMARPGIGKTVLLCHTVTRAVEASRLALVFSLEMPAAQIVARIAGMHYQVAPRVLWDTVRAGRRTEAQWAADMPTLWVCDRGGLSVPEMSALVAQAERTVGAPALVVIDHLGLIGGDRRLSTYDRVSTQARELKELAKRHHCAVLAAIQVSREAGGLYGEKRHSLGSARDSGVIEEAMDYLLGMRRVDRVPTLPDRESYRDILWLEVLKHRHSGVTGQEHAYWMSDQGLHLVEQADCPAPELSGGSLYDFGGRRARR